MSGAPAGPAEDLALIVEAARAAGAVALSFFRNDPRRWTKDGASPVSEADIAADDLLRTRLTAARPGYGWLSEETADDLGRLDRERVFVVDPIDGTRAFLAGEEQWVVSVAVVEAGRPLVGVLVQPTAGREWTATLGGGAYRDGARVAVAARGEGPARVAGPRKFMASHPARHLTSAGFVPSLALRIARVADGSAEGAFATARAHDWDLAAADLLVHEAGGRLTTADGSEVRYNARVPRHPPLVAASAARHAELRRVLSALEAY